MKAPTGETLDSGTAVESPQQGPEVPPEELLPTEAAPAAEEPHLLEIQGEEGRLVARNLEEVRDWIFDGRVWPNDLVSTPAGEVLRADRHPLTRELFAKGPEQAKTEQEPMPEPAAASTAPAEDSPAEGAEGEEPPSPRLDDIGLRDAAATDATPFPEAPGRDEALSAAGTDLAFLRRAPALPLGVRALGVANLVISLLLPPNPVGVIAAVGLLRGKAWGRTLTLAWAGLEVFTVLLVWFGLTAVELAKGGLRAPLGDPTLDLIAQTDFSTPFVIGGTVLAAYLIAQWSYLSQPDVIGEFSEGGERAALWSGWSLGWLYLVAALVGTNAFLDQWSGRPRAEQTEQAPAPGDPAGDLGSSALGLWQDRIFTADGLASIEAVSGWQVKQGAGAEDAKLGVLLKGRRENPLGTLRLSSAKPDALERLNQRFDDLQEGESTIRAVEEVSIADLRGRRIVMASPVKGGLTGQIMLSLHDDTRAYQFACAAPGPGFKQIRAECERMAESLLITKQPVSKGRPGPGAALPSSRRNAGAPAPAGRGASGP